MISSIFYGIYKNMDFWNSVKNLSGKKKYI